MRSATATLATVFCLAHDSSAPVGSPVTNSEPAGCTSARSVTDQMPTTSAFFASDLRWVGRDDLGLTAIILRSCPLRITRLLAWVAASALEDALRGREIHSTTNLSLRSDNGLVFGAKAFVRVTRRYSVSQEYITPYSPEQNGMIERFFKTLKEECVWLHRFPRLRRHRGAARALRRRAATLGARIPYAEGVPREISCLTCTKNRGTPQDKAEAFFTHF